jgi:hypothetical protein
VAQVWFAGAGKPIRVSYRVPLILDSIFSALIHLSAWIFAVCFAGQHVLVVLQEGGFVEISQSKQVLLNRRFLPAIFSFQAIFLVLQ